MDARPQVQILLISCSFWENLAKSYVGVPLEGWRPHLRETLDPPLLSVSHSVHGGGLCMMPLSVWPPGCMFLLGISVFGPMFLPGGGLPDRDPSGQRPPLRQPPGQRPRPPGRDPPCKVKSGWYASLWNACLFSSSNIKFVFKPPEFQNVHA